MPVLLAVVAVAGRAQGGEAADEASARRSILEDTYADLFERAAFARCLAFGSPAEEKKFQAVKEGIRKLADENLAKHTEDGDLAAAVDLKGLLDYQQKYWKCPEDKEQKSADTRQASGGSAQAGPGTGRAHHAATPLPPPVMHFCGAHCSTLYLSRDKTGYAGTPDYPTVPEGAYGLHIRQFDRRGVIFDRMDPPNQWFPQGLKAVITGEIDASGDRLANGTLQWTFGMGGGGPVQFTWGEALDEIPGHGDPVPAAAAGGNGRGGLSGTAVNEGTRVRAEGVVNNGFLRWASRWAMDRFQAGSAHIEQMGCQSQGCDAVGRFSFVRMGGLHTIPFSAHFENTAPDEHRLTQLCYRDDSTGMQECQQ